MKKSVPPASAGGIKNEELRMHLVLGTWFLVFGSWFLVLGFWFLVLGSFSKVLISNHYLVSSFSILHSFTRPPATGLRQLE